jgi:hypothetical protein
LEEDAWALVSFGRAFQTEPVVVSQVQTENDPHWVKTRQQDVTVAGFDVAMEEEDAKMTPHDGGDTADAGAFNKGVAGTDSATGTGYILYSEESVHTRFTAQPPNSYNADHFICVIYSGGQWRYDYNSGYYAFTPRSGDVLVAAVDFDADAVVDLKGESGTQDGIAYGYGSGNLAFEADVWDGVANDGEFSMSGTYFTTNGDGAVAETVGWLAIEPGTCTTATGGG